jgi:glucose 1-dehydrogenase
MQIRLDGKRAIVTGANSGIGEAIALALAEAGACVAINYLTHPEAAQSLVQQIVSQSGEATALLADISDPDAVAAMFQKVDEIWGGVDILVNNAGIDGGHAISWEGEIASWRKVIEVNLMGSYYCSREALKRMVPQKKGVVLNISSVHEEIDWTGYSAYTASKAGISMLTKTMAQEAAPHGVRVLALAPGAIETPINRSVWSDPKSRQDLLDKIPLNRIGTPQEIANMVVVLVSDAASYVTGRSVFVDGGMTDYPDFSHGG